MQHPQHARLRVLGQGYTVFVRFARLALPVAAIVIIAFVVMQMNNTDSQITPATDIPAEERTRPGELQLIRAEYQGRDVKGRPYKVSADSATRLPEKPDSLALQNPTGEILLRPDEKLVVTAAFGDYDNRNDTLYLSGDVVLRHENTGVMRFDDMHVNLAAYTARSDKPVTAENDDIKVTGQKFDMRDGGNVIIFYGPATATVKRKVTP